MDNDWDEFQILLLDNVFHHAVCQISLIPGSETHFKTNKGKPDLVCVHRIL